MRSLRKSMRSKYIKMSETAFKTEFIKTFQKAFLIAFTTAFLTALTTAFLKAFKTLNKARK